MELSHKEKTHFRNLDSIFKIFKKKMTLIADGFLNFQTPKKVVR